MKGHMEWMLFMFCKESTPFTSLEIMDAKG